MEDTDKFSILKRMYPELLSVHYMECGDGWSDILNTMLRAISALKHSELVKIVEIKKKFGYLRVSYFLDAIDNEDWYPEKEIDDLNDAVRKIIDEAEVKSWSVCEICGAPGSFRKLRYWEKIVLCDKHFVSWPQ